MFIGPQRISPFDYDYLNEETEPLIMCEDFVRDCVWARNYSSTVLGIKSRPPLAAVARDMIAIVGYFKKLSISGSRPLAGCLKDFLVTTPLLSISSESVIEENWVTRGYLADAMVVVLSWPWPFPWEDASGWDLKQASRRIVMEKYHDLRHVARTWADRRSFPDGIFNYNSSLAGHQVSQELYGSLEIVDAAYINSGPYKIVLTEDIYEHLTLSGERKLRLFWEGVNEQGEVKCNFPGDFLARFATHTLGRFVPLSDIPDH